MLRPACLHVVALSLCVGCGPATVRPPNPDSTVDGGGKHDGDGGDLGDGRLPDGLAPDVGPLRCAGVDGTTVALLTFDTLVGGRFADAVGRHPGELRQGSPALVLGQPGCIKALQLDGQTYIEIPDSPEWDLAQGAVDLWVRFDPNSSGTYAGLVSRDANGTNTEGHFTIARACDGSVVVRLQRGGKSYARCSGPVPDNAWLHVGVNFGTSLELWVDGREATRTDAVPTGASCSSMQVCGVPISGGIDGNDNPWVVGATSVVSDDGKATPVHDFLAAAIDNLRISSDPRDFSAP